MTAKEKLHQQIEELSDAEAADARIVVKDQPDVDDDMSHIPEYLRYFDDGTPQPNWEAAIRRVRGEL